MKRQFASLRFVVAIAAPLLAASCSSMITTDKGVDLGEGVQRELPYRVAIVPVQPDEFNLNDAAEAGQAPDLLSAAPAGERFDLLTLKLRESLEENVFIDAVILDAPTGREATDRDWVELAKAAKADLLIDVEEVRYDSLPKSKAIWSSYALFLTGPLEIFFPDRRYKFDGASLEASIYDVNLLDGILRSSAQAAQVASPADGEWRADDWEFSRDALLRDFRIKPDDLKLRYADRVEGLGAWSLFKSFLIPTANMANSGEHVREELAEWTAVMMARGLSERIVEGDYAYLNAPSPRVADFFIGDDPRIEATPGGYRIVVLLEQYKGTDCNLGSITIDDAEPVDFVIGDTVGAMEASLRQGSAVAAGFQPLTESELNSGRAQNAGSTPKMLHIQLPSAGVRPASSGAAQSDETGWVHLEIRDGRATANPQTRSWTLRLPRE